MPMILPYNPLQAIIQTGSLPNTNVGAAYSATVVAAGAVPPYTYSITADSGNFLSINPVTGVITGTATVSQTELVTVVATDSLGTAGVPKTFTFIVNPAVGSVGAPAGMFAGWAASSSLEITWWPPPNAGTAGNPTYYNIYRDGSLFYGTSQGVSAGGAPTGGGVTPYTQNPNKPWSFWFVDTGLPPNTTHTYNVTAVTGTAESGFSVPLTMSSLGAGGPTVVPTPPTPPADPATWIQDGTGAVNATTYKLPTGGTTWTCTQTTEPAGNSSGATGSGPKGNVGCSFQFALLNASPGDIIVLTAGATYLSSAGKFGWTFQSPANFVGPQWVYIISSEDPVFKAGGALPAYSVSTALGGGNYVTPANRAAMATIQFSNSNAGLGLKITQASKNVRFVGIWFTPAPNIVNNSLFDCIGFDTAAFSIPITLCDHIYFDRCGFGNDSTSASYSYLRHGMIVTTAHWFVHQCFFQDIADTSGADNLAMGSLGGSFICIENNYIAAASEGMINGGGFVPQSQVPTDVVYRYNTNTKLLAWQTMAIGNKVKNHFEFKTGLRMEAYGNYHSNCWHCVEPSGAQEGRSFVMGARDQNALLNIGITGTISNGSGGAGNILNITAFTFSPALMQLDVGHLIEGGTTAAGTLITARLSGTGGLGTYQVSVVQNSTCTLATAGIFNYQTNPWCNVMDINIHDNVCYNVGAGLYAFTDDNNPSCTTNRLRFANNQVLVNPPATVQNNFTGVISGTTLTVSNFSGVVNLSTAFYVQGSGSTSVLPYTQILSQQSGTTNQNGVYTINKSQNVSGPMVTVDPTQPFGININGPISDVIIDHNTVLVNQANANIQNSGNASCSIYSVNDPPYVNASTETPHPWPRNADRVQVTNNIFDGIHMLYGDGGPTGTSGVATAFGTNAQWTHNLATTDAVAYPGTNFKAAYASIGFQNFQGVTGPPTNPHDWNVTSTANATNSTTGGPLGAIFP